MNYIFHLTGFYDKIQEDNRLNPTHISLYLALFQFWNLNRFRNPISISRNEMMKLSKISAFGTYHKCIKELQEFGYIEYIPSFNPYKGSLVNLFSFDNSEAIQNLNMKRIKKQTASEQVANRMRIKIDTGSEQALIPSINSTNSLNNKQLKDNEHSRIFDEGNLLLKKKNRSIEIPPNISEVEIYFLERDSTKLEAERFFNHYESNGWLVGGKALSGAVENLTAAAKDSTVVDIAGVGSQIHAIDIALLQIPCLDKLGKVDKVGVACAGRERLIGRITIAGRRKGQNLPVMLFARGEKIDEVVGIPAKAADSVWSGQR